MDAEAIYNVKCSHVALNAMLALNSKSFIEIYSNYSKQWDFRAIIRQLCEYRNNKFISGLQRSMLHSFPYKSILTNESFLILAFLVNPPVVERWCNSYTIIPKLSWWITSRPVEELGLSFRFGHPVAVISNSIHVYPHVTGSCRIEIIMTTGIIIMMMI